jgi:putative endonuclease
LSRAKGNIAEQKAELFLLENGYEIIERNFYSRFGEIDIITIKEDVLGFVEVKSGDDYELAVQNITPSKISKILKTANVYMKKHKCEYFYSINAVIVTPDAIELIENITL